MEDFKETCVTRIQGDSHISVYTSERKHINQIMKFKEEYPDDVIINNINSDGSVNAWLPYDWFRMPKPKAHRNLTEEQKAEAAERMRKVSLKRNNKGV